MIIILHVLINEIYKDLLLFSLENIYLMTLELVFPELLFRQFLCSIHMLSFSFKLHNFCYVNSWRPHLLSVLKPLKGDFWKHC